MNKTEERKDNQLDTSQLFRMPWTNSDNAFSWLEITRRCDLSCGYCYQTNDPLSDKPVPVIRREVETILSLRKTDTMFISGGEPLLHPELLSVVRMVSGYGVKPVLVTNGYALSKERIKELKHAGLFGFIIHVDRGQARPGWTGKSEKELEPISKLIL